MKSYIPLMQFCLMIASGHAQTLHGIGSKNLMEMSCPEILRVVQESEKTAFAMPGKIDENGPISLRISCFRDARKEGVDENSVKELFQKLTGSDQTFKAGTNFYATSTETRPDPEGRNWIYKTFYIFADDYVLFATVQIVEARKDEDQCKQLLDSIPSIIRSIKRKTNESKLLSKP